MDDVKWSRLDAPGDWDGISCDAHGPSIGPVRLLKWTGHEYKPRPVEELDFVLSSAFGFQIDSKPFRKGLHAIASALAKQDLARAGLITQFMWLPRLSDNQALDRALSAEALIKAGFDPAQARDELGRWTAEEFAAEYSEPNSLRSNFLPAQALVNPPIPWLEEIIPPAPLPQIPPFPGEILPPPIFGNPDQAIPQSLPRTLDNPFPSDPDCENEWWKAKRYCKRLSDDGLLGTGDYREHGRRFEQCVRGQVSERCGGNPINRTPKKSKPQRWNWPDTDHHLQA